jgi:hypothetical protein
VGSVLGQFDLVKVGSINQVNVLISIRHGLLSQLPLHQSFPARFPVSLNIDRFITQPANICPWRYVCE